MTTRVAAAAPASWSSRQPRGQRLGRVRPDTGQAFQKLRHLLGPRRRRGVFGRRRLGQQPDRVPVPQQIVQQGRGQRDGAFQRPAFVLARPGVGVPAQVQGHDDVQRHALGVLGDGQRAGPGRRPPVDPPQLVARRVLAHPVEVVPRPARQGAGRSRASPGPPRRAATSRAGAARRGRRPVPRPGAASARTSASPAGRWSRPGPGRAGRRPAAAPPPSRASSLPRPATGSGRGAAARPTNDSPRGSLSRTSR